MLYASLRWISLDTPTAGLLCSKIDFGSCFQEVSRCIRIVHGLGGGVPRIGSPTVRHELIPVTRLWPWASFKLTAFLFLGRIVHRDVLTSNEEAHQIRISKF